jgi:hypothetical protein
LSGVEANRWDVVALVQSRRHIPTGGAVAGSKIVEAGVV